MKTFRNAYFSAFLLQIFATSLCNAQVYNITKNQGIGQSPGFGGKYPNGAQTRWYISLPDNNKFISLTFTFMQVEGYPNAQCVYDWVQIFDGNSNQFGSICDTGNLNKPNLRIFCNSHLPSLRVPMVLNTSKIIIEFCSDKVIQMSGFFFYWLTSDNPPPPITPSPSPQPTSSPTLPAPVLCGQSIALSLGSPYVLNSPGYPPGPYPNNQLCTWNVTSPTGHIQIQTTFFDVESYGLDCVFDRLVITTIAGTQTRFCGSIGPSYADVGAWVSIQFMSDMQIQRLGFSLNLIAASIPTTPPPVNPHCGSVFNLMSLNDSAVLYTPGWPENYPSDASCSWTINNALYSSGMAIQFLFLKFSTESGYDSLQVIPSSGQAQGFEGHLPDNITRLFNAPSLTANFTSDYSITYSGFHIVVTLAPVPFTCSMGQFKCKSGNICINGTQRCDGNVDCPDNSDENSNWCLMPQVCGKMVVQPNIYVPGQVLVVGGTEAKPGSWPWTVSVHKKSTGSQFCDATLISPHWVICAAHCFFGRSGNPWQFIIKVGSYRVKQEDKPYEIDMGIRNIWVNPKYRDGTYDHDISVVRLDGEVPFGNGSFNNHTGVACLTNPGYIVPPGSNCVITGWGNTQHTGSNLILRQAVVPIVSNTVCNSSLDYQGKITSDMICAGYPQGGIDTCSGDSGGPLVCRSPSTGNWVLQGITSWGEGCAKPNRPGVYSRVSSLIDWALQMINLND